LGDGCYLAYEDHFPVMLAETVVLLEDLHLEIEVLEIDNLDDYDE
jgi:hypothetical protein